MSCGVYAITNEINGKRYVGSAKNIKRRFAEHKRDLNGQKHHNIVLQRSWNKYGEQSFSFDMIEECDEERRIEREQWYLDNEKNLYNIAKEATCGDHLTNHPNRDAIIEQIRISCQKTMDSLTAEEKSKKFGTKGEANPLWRGGIDALKHICPKCGGWKAKKTAEACQGCMDYQGENNPFAGKQHTEHAKLKQREAKRNIFRKVEINNVVYDSISEAAKIMKMPAGTVASRCQSKNFKEWRYLNAKS